MLTEQKVDNVVTKASEVLTTRSVNIVTFAKMQTVQCVNHCFFLVIPKNTLAEFEIGQNSTRTCFISQKQAGIVSIGFCTSKPVVHTGWQMDHQQKNRISLSSECALNMCT